MTEAKMLGYIIVWNRSCFPLLSRRLVRKAVVTLSAADDGGIMATPASCSLRSWTQTKQPASGRRRAQQLLNHKAIEPPPPRGSLQMPD
ncbi:hypothetical protein LY76DRAFT_328295 [Colletotrichum caudatum]|nr:hypothetical protein LY76DRAFT_328295 [Colletotrichum caudatum]